MKWFLFFRNNKMTSSRTVHNPPCSSSSWRDGYSLSRNTRLQPRVSRPRGGTSTGRRQMRGAPGADRSPAAAHQVPTARGQVISKGFGPLHCCRGGSREPGRQTRASNAAAVSRVTASAACFRLPRLQSHLRLPRVAPRTENGFALALVL